MAKILSFDNPSSKDLRENPIKFAWEYFSGLDKFLQATVLVFVLLIAATPFIVSNYQVFKPNAARGGGNTTPTPPPAYSPMTLIQENYQPAHGVKTYFDDDDKLFWKVVGSLKPGETYSFTPQMESSTYGENSAILVNVTQNPNLEISTVVPNAGNFREVGKTISSTTGNLCMFMPTRAIPDSQGITIPMYNYTITIKNTGTTTINNITVNGIHENGWIGLMYSQCMYSDADRDGFNDSTEDALAYSTRDGFFNLTSQNWPYSQAQFKCCTYLSPTFNLDTGKSDQFQIGGYPPDFNNDGVVDQTDVNRITNYLGQGDGIPMPEINVTPGNYQGYEMTVLNNFFQVWRRFDLNLDGYVNQEDLNIVQKLVGQPIPMQSDIIPPTTRVQQVRDGNGTYTTTVPSGAGVEIDAYGWDNEYLTKIEFYVNGNIIYTQTKAHDYPYIFHLFQAPWNVPKKQGATYNIYTKAYDQAGNTFTSKNFTLVSN